MQRSTIIASVVAGAGILIAGSVAGTAAVNAAASSEPDPSTSQLLAAPDVVAEPAAAVTGSAAASLAPFTTEPLPPITSAPSSSGPAPEDGMAVEPSPAAAAVQLPPEQALALVVTATGGGTPLDVVQSSRAGYHAWAVTVQRPDGSVVTGFVDRATATIFDWRIVQEAPKPAPVTAAYQDDEYEGEEYEGEEYEGEEHEGEEHEGENEQGYTNDEHEEDGDDD